MVTQSQAVNKTFFSRDRHKNSIMNQSKISDLSELIRSSYLPKIELKDERPLNDEDCEKYIDHGAQVMKEVLELFKDQQKNIVINRDVAKYIIVPSLILIGEHIVKAPWNTHETLEMAQEMFEIIKKVYSLDSLHSIVEKYSKVIPDIIEELLPRIEKDNWKHHPSSVASLNWIIQEIHFPLVSNYLSEFLPFILRLLDDWQVDHKILGIHLIHHVIKNVSSTELTWFGRDKVLEDILKRVSTYKEKELIEITIPAYISLAKLIQPPLHTNPLRKMDIVDRVVMTTLEVMELESEIECKRILCNHFRECLDIIDDHGLIRWLTRISRVSALYLQIEDYDNDKCRMQIMDILMVTMDKVGIRIVPHTHDVLKELIRVLFEHSVKKEINQEVWDKTVKCMKRYFTLGPKKCHYYSYGLDEAEVNPPFDKAIREVMSIKPAEDDDSVVEEEQILADRAKAEEEMKRKAEEEAALALKPESELTDQQLLERLFGKNYKHQHEEYDEPI